MFEWLTERTFPSQADFCKLGGTQRASPVYVNCMFDRYFASNCADSLKGYKNARNMDDVRSRSNCQLPVPEKDIRSPNIVSSYNNFFYSTKICWIPNHEIVSPCIFQDFKQVSNHLTMFSRPRRYWNQTRDNKSDWSFSFKSIIWLRLTLNVTTIGSDTLRFAWFQYITAVYISKSIYKAFGSYIGLTHRVNSETISIPII